MNINAQWIHAATISFAILLPSSGRAAESPGPSSHRTGLVFSEIMYHPPDRPDGLDGERPGLDVFVFILLGGRISLRRRA